MKLFQKQLLSILILLVIVSCKKNTQDDYVEIDKDSRIAANATFVGREACINCHKKEYETWQGSHHDQAMKIADSSSVLGNFDNVTFQYNDGEAKFFKKGTDFYVNIKGPDDVYKDYKIVYTFGFSPLQQYIVPLKNGKFQCLSIAWDSEKNKWFHLYPDLTIATNERIHWTGEAMRWNNACADCHSTDLKKNYTPKTQTYHTTFKEIDVSCEACHGPASQHVNYYSGDSLSGISKKLVMTSATSPTDLVDACARCHSRRSQLIKDYTHAEDFLNQYQPALLTPPTYEKDGQIKDEDYVYGSFVQSKMYQNGVSCRDCHNMHSLKLKQTGNDLCLQCHAASYNEPSHHHHESGTKSSLCINCHMTGQTYMQNDFRRDHSFRIPRPDQSVAYGTPNACNTCHTDKDAKWAVSALKKWGLTQAIDAKNHFSDYLLAGYDGDKNSFYHIMENKHFPDLVRATATRNYTESNLTPEEIKNLRVFLKDTSALVRQEIVNFYTKLGDTTQVKEIAPLLKDPSRLVRMYSAKYVAVFGTDNTKESFKKAHTEYLNFLDMNADFSGGQEEIAEYEYLKNNPEKAIKAYKTALAFDDYNNNARLNLAYLYYMQNDIKKSAKLYEKVIVQQPDNSYPYYMLGLLFNELGKDEASLNYLKKASERKPFNFRAYYNYALKLQQKQRFAASINVVDNALEELPYNSELLYVKLIGLMRLNKIKQAKKVCQKLISLNPENQNFQQIFEQLKKSKQ